MSFHIDTKFTQGQNIHLNGIILTGGPTKSPSRSPTKIPSRFPTKIPSRFPTKIPSRFPTNFPSNIQTNNPTEYPLKISTGFPSRILITHTISPSRIIQSSSLTTVSYDSTASLKMACILLGILTALFCIAPILELIKKFKVKSVPPTEKITRLDTCGENETTITEQNRNTIQYTEEEKI